MRRARIYLESTAFEVRRGNISQKCSCSPGLGGDAIHYINGATLDDYSCAFALARNSPWRYPSTASRKSLWAAGVNAETPGSYPP